MPSCHGLCGYPYEQKSITQQIKDIEESLSMEVRKNALLKERIEELQKENEILRNAIKIVGKTK